MRHRNIAVLSLLAVLAALLVVPASASPLTAPICFSQVPDCIDGRFAEFWQQNGGLPVFGLPKSPASQQQVEGKTYLVQLFERNRFELHPENARPYDVLLGRLGDDLLKRQGRDWNTFPKVGGPPQPGCLFFGQTGHSTCGSILRMYRANGLEFDGRGGKSEAESLALFGLPLSEPQVEDTPNGKFTVQWFERARFEVHPENSAPYDVLLGLLGNETAAAPAPPPAPPAPPGPAPLPPSVNAVARPERGPRGTTFVFGSASISPYPIRVFSARRSRLPPMIMACQTASSASGRLMIQSCPQASGRSPSRESIAIIGRSPTSRSLLSRPGSQLFPRSKPQKQRREPSTLAFAYKVAKRPGPA
jgi:hypothetical protein